MKNTLKGIVALAMIAFAVNMGNTTYTQAKTINQFNPDPDCICASHRYGGVCSGATTRLCQGKDTCKCGE